jgi:hypothetical protein
VHFVPRFGPGSAWILRLHHCYADGMALLRVLLSLSEQDAGPALAVQTVSHPRPGASRRGTPLLSLFDWLEHLAQPTGDDRPCACSEPASGPLASLRKAELREARPGMRHRRIRVYAGGGKTTLLCIGLCGLVLRPLIIPNSCMDAAPVAEWFRWVEAPHVFLSSRDKGLFPWETNCT